mmetsp:Transcript_14237/g.32755  ORF Transcript_14237/g.32755 Transcript_14237/m.32755 type:complete len:102 (-) Transcript_14237:78-383(-)
MYMASSSATPLVERVVVDTARLVVATLFDSMSETEKAETTVPTGAWPLEARRSKARMPGDDGREKRCMVCVLCVRCAVFLCVWSRCENKKKKEQCFGKTLG